MRRRIVTFHYYVGLSGYDQAARFIDNNDGAQFNYLGSPYGEYGFVGNNTFTGEGVLNTCDPNFELPSGSGPAGLPAAKWISFTATTTT